MNFMKMKFSLFLPFIILGFPLIILIPFLKHFHLSGDDFALVYHSAYFSKTTFFDWFTFGFRDYFINYDGYTPYFTNFIRPLTNLTFYIESLITPIIGACAYMITNLVGYSLLIWPLSKIYRFFKIDDPLLKTVGIFISLYSLSFVNALTSPAFRTNLLMVLMTLLSFSFMIKGKRIFLCFVFSILAFFSHEVGLVTPFLLFLFYLFFKYPEEKDSKTLIKVGLYALIVYLLYFLTKLFIFQKIEDGGAGIYVFNQLDNQISFIPKIVGRFLRGLKNPFFYAVSGKNYFLRGLSFFVFSFAGFSLYQVIRERKNLFKYFDDKRIQLNIIGGFALISFFSIHMISDAPRHNGFGNMMMAIFFLKAQKLFFERFKNKRMSLIFKWGILILVSGITVNGFYQNLVFTRDGTIASMIQTKRYYQNMTQLFKGMDHQKNTHYFFLNEAYGGYASKHLIKLAIEEAEIDDYSLTLVNSISSSVNSPNSFIPPAITCKEETIEIISSIPSYSDLVFWGTPKESLFKEGREYRYLLDHSSNTQKWTYETSKRAPSKVIFYNYKNNRISWREGCSS